MAEQYVRIPANEVDGNKIVFRGCAVPEHYLDISEVIDDFEVKQDDVWVVSFPKTGTTWTQEIVWCIKNNLDFEGAKQNIATRFPYFEHCMLKVKQLQDGQDIRPPFIRYSLDYVAALPSPRFIKTHLPWQLLPKQIRDNVKQPKIIYVARNAKDTCVSFYHHHRLLIGYKESFDDFCQKFLEDRMIYTPFWKHVLTSWEQRHRDNVLFITFEDMKKDLPQAIRQIANFLGQPLNDAQTSALAEHVSFRNMKVNKAVNLEHVVKLRGGTDEDAFIRKGEVGGWREVMSDEIVQKFNKYALKYLQDTGLELQEE